MFRARVAWQARANIARRPIAGGVGKAVVALLAASVTSSRSRGRRHASPAAISLGKDAILLGRSSSTESGSFRGAMRGGLCGYVC